MEGKSYGCAQWSQSAVGGEDRVSPPCAAYFRRRHERIIRGTVYTSGVQSSCFSTGNDGIMLISFSSSASCSLLITFSNFYHCFPLSPRLFTAAKQNLFINLMKLTHGITWVSCKLSLAAIHVRGKEQWERTHAAGFEGNVRAETRSRRMLIYIKT